MSDQESWQKDWTTRSRSVLRAFSMWQRLYLVSPAVLLVALGLVVIEHHEGYRFDTWELPTTLTVAAIALLVCVVSTIGIGKAQRRIDTLEDEAAGTVGEQ